MQTAGDGSGVMNVREDGQNMDWREETKAILPGSTETGCRICGFGLERFIEERVTQ